MSEYLQVAEGDKAQKYRELLPQISALIGAETDLIANLANMCAALKMTFDWLWIGFYLVKEEQLVLGPFQGPIACTRIGKGKGVCGTAWQSGRTQIVANVDLFPGHIACSSLSQSEIVVPLFNTSGEIIGVLDVDSIKLETFDDEDQYWLELLLREITLAMKKEI